MIDTTTIGAPSTTTHDGWNGWRLDADQLALSRGHHVIDLTRCRTAAAVLDNLLDVSRLRWATSEIVAGALSALDDVLRVRGHITDGAALHGGPGLALTADDVERFVGEFARRSDR